MMQETTVMCICLQWWLGGLCDSQTQVYVDRIGSVRELFLVHFNTVI